MWDGSCNWGAERDIMYGLNCSLGYSNRVWYQEAMLSLIKGMSGNPHWIKYRVSTSLWLITLLKQLS